MLPEGANWLLFYQHYDAGSAKDNSGHDNPKLANFHLRLDALAPRLSYVWPGVRVFGANVETRVSCRQTSTRQLPGPHPCRRSTRAATRPAWPT
jgi:hypothetical protein